MKKIFSILALTIILASCSKDDAPTPILIPVQTTKVIDEIDFRFTSTNALPQNYTTIYEYNEKKEISKISLFRNGIFDASYTFTYENDIPVTGLYVAQGVPGFVQNYNYTNGFFSAVVYPSINSQVDFMYNLQTTEYTDNLSDLAFKINAQDDITNASRNGNKVTYTFDASKKGPFTNVVNKKWISLLWLINGLSPFGYDVNTTFPVTSALFDNPLMTVNYSNAYDVDGFIKTSSYASPDASITTEIKFKYKSI